jgi:hypothetical protein
LIVDRCLLPFFVGCMSFVGVAMQLGSASDRSVMPRQSDRIVLLGDSTWELVKQSPQTMVFCTPGGSMTSAGKHPLWPRNDPWLGRFLCWAVSQHDMPVFFGVVPPFRSCPAHSSYAVAAQALSCIPTGNSIVLSELLETAHDNRELWQADRVHLTEQGVKHVICKYFKQLTSHRLFQPGALCVVLADGWNEKKLQHGGVYRFAREALLTQTSLAGVLQAMQPFTCSSSMQRPLPFSVSRDVGTSVQRLLDTCSQIMRDHINIGPGYIDVHAGDIVNCTGPLQSLPEANPRTAVLVHKVVLGSDGGYFILDRVAPAWVLSSYFVPPPNAPRGPCVVSMEPGYQLVISDHIDTGPGCLNVFAGEIVHCTGPLLSFPEGNSLTALLAHKVFVCSDGCYIVLDHSAPALVLSSYLVPAPMARQRFSC